MEKDNIILKDVTVHLMIKNGERYCKEAIESVVPYVSKYLIYDTGSTDGTIKIIEDLMSKWPQIKFNQKIVGGDSINWNGQHLSQDLTDIRNELVKMTNTKWIMQQDDDEVYPFKTIAELDYALNEIKNKDINNFYKGIQVPIYWMVNNKNFLKNGPFPKTLRIFDSKGDWRGKFPDEFYYIDNRPMTMLDTRCHTIRNGFFHYSMVLHPERRPIEGDILDIECLNL